MANMIEQQLQLGAFTRCKRWRLSMEGIMKECITNSVDQVIPYSPLLLCNYHEAVQESYAWIHMENTTPNFP